MLADGFRAAGRVCLTNAQIGGDLRCSDAEFGSGLVAERTVVKGTIFWRKIRNPTTASLNLINTSADSLSDDSTSWPTSNELQLHGFQYRRISAFSPRDAHERLTWLAHLKSFTPQPYRHFASVLRDEGDDVGARQVLFRMAVLRSEETRSWFTRARNFLLQWTVGYGYYPRRALFWLLGLVALGTVLYWAGYNCGSMVPTDKAAYAFLKGNGRPPDYYERFHALAYSLENSFPPLKLGQQDHWQPDPSRDGTAGFTTGYIGSLVRAAISASTLRIFRWVQIVLGWFFATMGVAAVTGLVRRD